MKDVLVETVEIWVGAYVAGVLLGLLEMAWYAWRTRGVKLEGDGAWFWRQYVGVILGWPVVVSWAVWSMWRNWRESSW